MAGEAEEALSKDFDLSPLVSNCNRNESKTCCCLALGFRRKGSMASELPKNTCVEIKLLGIAIQI